MTKARINEINVEKSQISGELESMKLALDEANMNFEEISKIAEKVIGTGLKLANSSRVIKFLSNSRSEPYPEPYPEFQAEDEPRLITQR